MPLFKGEPPQLESKETSRFEKHPQENGLSPLMLLEERLTVIDNCPHFVPCALYIVRREEREVRCGGGLGMVCTSGKAVSDLKSHTASRKPVKPPNSDLPLLTSPF
jgi:hypothetical protein